METLVSAGQSTGLVVGSLYALIALPGYNMVLTGC